MFKVAHKTCASSTVAISCPRCRIIFLSVTLTKHSSGLLVLEQTVLGIRSDCTSVGSTIKALLCGVVSHVSLTTELGGITVRVGLLPD